MAVTHKDALIYLGIDDDADQMVNANVDRALAAAKATLRGAVGDLCEALADDPRADQLILIYTDDLYSNRGRSAKVEEATRRAVSDMELQLRMDNARLEAT